MLSILNSPNCCHLVKSERNIFSKNRDIANCQVLYDVDTNDKAEEYAKATTRFQKLLTSVDV